MMEFSEEEKRTLECLALMGEIRAPRMSQIWKAVFGREERRCGHKMGAILRKLSLYGQVDFRQERHSVFSKEYVARIRRK